MALITLEQFRKLRDENALNSYRARWPVLMERKINLRKQMDTLAQLVTSCFVITDGCRHAYEENIKEMRWEYQEVCGQLASIEKDAIIRKAQLAGTFKPVVAARLMQ